MLSLPVHEQKTCLSIFKELWFLSSIFQAIRIQVLYTFFVVLHLSIYFCLSNYKCYRCVFFLISVSILEYRNKIYFSIFILYPATLLNSLNILGMFLLVPWNFLWGPTMMSFVKWDSFTFFFPICVPFISLCLTTLARISALCSRRVTKSNILYYSWS